MSLWLKVCAKWHVISMQSEHAKENYSILHTVAKCCAMKASVSCWTSSGSPSRFVRYLVYMTQFSFHLHSLQIQKNASKTKRPTETKPSQYQIRIKKAEAVR